MSIPTISGGVFNFIVSGYIPPTWSGTIYSFGDSSDWVWTGVDCYQAWLESNTGQWVDYSLSEWNVCVQELLNQIWTDENYVYAAIDFGLDIIDIVSKSKIAYASGVYGGFTTVWANETNVFLGTINAGVKFLGKSTISGSMIAPYNLSDYLQDLDFVHGTSSSGTRYLHGNGNFLLNITDTEIDVLQMGNNPYRSSSTTVSGNAYKGFMTSTGKFYYTVSGSQWSVERVNVPVMDWTTPHVSYVADGSVIASGIRINDIFVTERTSFDGVNNTLFIATSSGVYVVDEGSLDYAIYYKEII